MGTDSMPRDQALSMELAEKISHDKECTGCPVTPGGGVIQSLPVPTSESRTVHGSCPRAKLTDGAGYLEGWVVPRFNFRGETSSAEGP
eukprot:768820-Hanusia_phi.AAC.1